MFARSQTTERRIAKKEYTQKELIRGGFE